MTTSAPVSKKPPPISPTSARKQESSRSYHWFIKSIVGTTTSVERFTCSIAICATRLLPAPVGSTTTPRLPCRRHSSIASRW